LARHNVKFLRLNQMGSPINSVTALFSLYAMLRRLRPDIVHAHMMKSALLAAALRPLLGFKLVTSVHNEFQRSAIAMGVGQRVIGVSHAVSKAMIGRGIAPAKIRTVLNGTLNSPRRPLPAPAPLVLRHPAVVTVCGLHPRKGIADLIAAFGIVAESFPGAHLYVVGSGPMEAEYKLLAQQTRPMDITFLGHIPDPRPVMLAADVFVLASHSEPAGLVLSEAREAGCAIVATDVGGIPEMLSDGSAGVLVPPRRPDLLAKAISNFLGDPSYSATMRQRTQHGLDRFTMERVASETEQIYMELLA
jgi:glycosyltransferase involved in cell wall biosynthesis